MNLILIANIITCICALIGFIYGIIKFFKPKKAVYPQMITLAVGCMAFGRLYQVVRLLTGGEILNSFQLGLFGIIGSLMFLFSANYGAIDSLADDGSKEFTKYRIVSVAAPLVAAALYFIFIFAADTAKLTKIIYGIITVFVMLASYFHLKHLIFPDVDFGVIRCLKPYNLLALIYSFICMAEMILLSVNSKIGILLVGVVMGGLLIGIVISVERGIKKWTT